MLKYEWKSIRKAHKVERKRRVERGNTIAEGYSRVAGGAKQQEQFQPHCVPVREREREGEREVVEMRGACIRFCVSRLN